MEFKGTKGKWEVTDPTNEFKWVNINADDGLPHLRSFWGEGVTKEEAKANAQLISKAPEMLAELHETLIDLKILRNQISESNKVDHRWDGMMDMVDKWIDRKEQLIKEATTTE